MGRRRISTQGDLFPDQRTPIAAMPHSSWSPPNNWQSTSDTAVARTSDPETSHQAAASISSSDIHRLRLEIHCLLLARGPMTDEAILRELQKKFAVTPSGARTRRSELVRLGLVKDSGVRGMTTAGHHTILWRAA